MGRLTEEESRLAAEEAVRFLAMIRRHKFRAGQRVRPSAYGIESLVFAGKKAEASGIVTKVDHFNSPTVLWDYRRTASSYFAGFIEPDRRRRSALSKQEKRD